MFINQLSYVSSNINSLKLVGLMDSTMSSKRKLEPQNLEKSAQNLVIKVFNTELIYPRVMCLLNIGTITLEDVLNYELPPILLSLFENTGDMRASKSKLDLKKALQVGTSLHLQPKLNVVITDDCAQL